MSEQFEQFDALFYKAAFTVFGSERLSIPYAEILRGAHLGFDLAFGRRLLQQHTWLAFLNRLWDAERVGGVPTGGSRVPSRIWGLVDSGGDEGRLHEQLLEATGMRLPRDFGQRLGLHLSLWQLSPAMRADGMDAEPTAICDGPVHLEIRRMGAHLEVVVFPEIAASFEITLHWPTGASITFPTAGLPRGGTGTYVLASPESTLPASAEIHGLNKAG